MKSYIWPENRNLIVSLSAARCIAFIVIFFTDALDFMYFVMKAFYGHLTYTKAASRENGP